MSKITIHWHGHACYSITADDYTIVLDPYAPGSVPGLRDLEVTANQVLCSHEHGDHGYTDAVTLKDACENPFHIQVLDTFHDDEQGTKRGPNRIHILEAHGIRVAHLGDLGCMPTPEQLEALYRVDAVMVPIGGFYTIDAVQAAELMMAVHPHVILPMHYRSETFGFPVIGTLDEYTAGCDDVVYCESDTIEITKDMDKHIAILVPGRA